MAHSVGQQAARAVANSNKVVVEKRTPEEIIKGIRANRAAKLFVTPSDVDFLLTRYDAAVQAIMDGDIERGELGLENDRIKELLAQSTNIINLGIEGARLQQEKIIQLSAQIQSLAPTQDELPVYDVLTKQTQGEV